MFILRWNQFRLPLLIIFTLSSQLLCTARVAPNICDHHQVQTRTWPHMKDQKQPTVTLITSHVTKIMCLFNPEQDTISILIRYTFMYEQLYVKL